MNKLLRAAAISALLMSVGNGARSQPKEGGDYLLLSELKDAPAVGQRVQVLGFFLYHCPYCARLYPKANSWAESRHDKVVFQHMHVTFRKGSDPQVRLFHTLKALNKADELASRIFEGLANKRVRLSSDAAALQWVGQNGMLSDTFLSSWNSPAVVNATANTSETVASYGLSYAPAYVVGGKYFTSPSLIKKNRPSLTNAAVELSLFNVLDFLVDRAANNSR